MQDDYSCQILLPQSDQSDFKLADMIDTEAENAESASSVATAKLRSVMTQREMEIVTTFFPKAAETLACVLGKRRLAEHEPGLFMHKEAKIMKWVTRERPKVDRMACPWLIKRFVDPQADFLYVPPKEVMEVARCEGAMPFDVPNVELGHKGTECSFDAIIKKYKLTDGPLARLAIIVRGADTAAKELAPESAGLEAIAEGFRIIYRNDQQLLEREMSVYDALYAYCQNTEERKPMP